MLRDQELRQAVIMQIVYHKRTFSEDIAEALGDEKERVARIMKSLAKEGYCDIYEGIFSSSQIHFIRRDEMKKLLSYSS